ncbi:MAG: sulfotransferase domain-containing protein [Acidimicrobiales bacterium]
MAPKLLWHCAAVTAGGDSDSWRNRAGREFLRLPPTVRRQLLHRLGRFAPWEPGFDFTPPTPGPGEVAGPPTFVGIGVQKAGTTWWYEQIARHPQVHTRPDVHKERHFFDRFGTEPFWPSAIDDYAGWFPRPAGMLAGEWTPDYITLPWVPALLRRAAPEARLLLLLRDPVDRLLSGLAHGRRMGDPVGTLEVADAVQRGFYHRSLRNWLAHFDPEQLLILQYERCAADPAGQLRTTTSFLGLDDSGPGPDRTFPAAADPEPPERQRKAPTVGSGTLDPEVTRRLVAIFEPDVVTLVEQVPSVDLSLWPNFSYLAGSTGSAASGDGSGGDPNSPVFRT